MEVVQALVVDPVSPSTIYAAAHLDTAPNSAEEIIYKSSDGGQNWRAVRAGIPAGATVSSLAIDPGSPSRIYATYGIDGGWGVIKSTDLGESWTVMNAGFPAGRFKASPVVIDPANPSTTITGSTYGQITTALTGAGGSPTSRDVQFALKYIF